MLKEGMIVGERYEIISRIGSGGMADVYKAKDHKLNRLVAVKVMKAEFSQDKGFISKFRKSELQLLCHRKLLQLLLHRLRLLCSMLFLRP